MCARNFASEAESPEPAELDSRRIQPYSIFSQKISQPTADDAIVQGSMERLSPILMTALVTGVGLIPLALGVGEPGKEIQQPMAVVILGGIFTSTFLNMIVIPGLRCNLDSLSIANDRNLLREIT